MEELHINLMFVIVGIASICKMADGYKKGLVKEIISLVSLAVLSVVVALVAYGLNSYHDGKFYNVVVIVLLLGILCIAHHLLKLVLFSAKMVAKLPVVRFGNKLLGMAFGVFEVVLALWIVYTFIMMMGMGGIGQVILAYTEENPVLLWIYRHNYLAYWIERILGEVDFGPLDVIGKLLDFGR